MTKHCEAPDCGKELPERARGARGPAKKYCNGSCKARASRLRDPERAARWRATVAKNKLKPKVELLCAYCREMYEAARKDSRHCGKPNCKRRYRNVRMAYYNSLRRAQLRVQTIDSFRTIDVYNRDGWICQLCQDPVDHTLEFPDPMSASLDHKKPLIKGGEHSVYNCQQAHLRCNQKKATK
jgi:hypothetical protein